MEDKELKLIEEVIKEYSTMDGLKEYTEALKKLLQAYKQDKKVIDEMAKALKSYANLGILIKCPAEYDGKYNYKNCKIDITKNRTRKTNELCNKCIIDYFRKKA